jgi:hypothetical protein
MSAISIVFYEQAASEIPDDYTKLPIIKTRKASPTLMLTPL